MNTYMVHMLERAREVHRLNNGETGRDSPVKCPFCVADEDENWNKQWIATGKKATTLNVKPQPPHCENCPLINVMHQVVGVPVGAPWKDVQGLMDDCVAIGFYLLKNIWEDSDV